jgi:integration host factor subunit alpha
MTVTKDSIVEVISRETGYQKKRSAEVVETLTYIIKSKLASGEDVLISGFGKFCVKEKHERKGRNPVTGEGMMLAPRRVVTFKCSGRLREKINQLFLVVPVYRNHKLNLRWKNTSWIESFLGIMKIGRLCLKT